MDSSPFADLVGIDVGDLGENTQRQLLGRHFEREDADHGAVGDLAPAHGVGLVAYAPRGVEGDVGGERRFAHRGAAGEDDEVGRLQAAHQLVEVLEAGRRAGQLALAAMGGLGHVDGRGQHRVEGAEAALDLAGGGEVEQLLLGLLDLGGGVALGREVAGVGHDLVADLDQLAAQVEVENDLPVMVGVGDGDRAVGEAHQVLRAAELDHGRIGFEQVLERDRVGDLAFLDDGDAGGVDALVQRFVEVLGGQEVRDLGIGQVVIEDRAEKPLLGFEIAGQLAQARGFAFAEGDDVGFHGART